MKRKYQGILSVGSLLVVMMIMGVYYRSGTWQRSPIQTRPAQAPVVDGWMPSPQQVRTMQHLSAKLNTLAVPASRHAALSPLLLFGQSDPQAMNGVLDGRHEVKEKTDYTLSLTLLAGPIRYCILDNAFVAEGEHLTDGAAVMKIDNQKVLIANGSAMQWIYLRQGPPALDRSKPLPATPRKGQS